MKIKSIINVLFSCILLIFILFTSFLSLIHPEWFLIVQNSYQTPQIHFINETNVSNIAPSIYCNTKNNCTYLNLPSDKPYILKTKFAWLYKNQLLYIVVMIIIGLALNWEKIRLWIHKISTSSK
jgi:hypothetical protein